ncbi:uncharacterized protein PSANT_05717 [Moesziomyces antarcticus]|uniref:HNH nuclease domain-containing protein n=1 Tax=Pseudozyma antarctica TaxID=84753 RepID=A0A5C3FX75_PSEA2|nr:uncharacterized protein PSANT_05717 [Moesziomyces antarcticus]
MVRLLLRFRLATPTSSTKTTSIAIPTATLKFARNPHLKISLSSRFTGSSFLTRFQKASPLHYFPTPRTPPPPPPAPGLYTVQLTDFFVFLSTTSGFVVDHIDQNRLNNVLSNLRLLSASDNALNVTRKKRSNAGFTGVTKNSTGSGYTARLRGKSLGTFPTAQAAKAARIQKLREEGKDDLADLETEPELTATDVKFLKEHKGKKKRTSPGTGQVAKVNSGFMALLRGRYLGFSKTKQGAEEILRQGVQKEAEEEARQAQLVVIPRTTEGHAYLLATCGAQVLVDDDIYMKYRRRVVSLQRGYPIVANKPLHSLVVQLRAGEDCIDHINHNKLDNRRANLRGTTYAINARNKKARSKTGYLGILRLPSGNYQARVWNTKVTPHVEVAQVFCDLEKAVRWRQKTWYRIYPEDRPGYDSGKEATLDTGEDFTSVSDDSIAISGDSTVIISDCDESED